MNTSDGPDGANAPPDGGQPSPTPPSKSKKKKGKSRFTLTINLEEAHSIMLEGMNKPMSRANYKTLKTAFDAMYKRCQPRYLNSEKTKDLEESAAQAEPAEQSESKEPAKKKPSKRHGRYGADAYKTAKRVPVAHPVLTSGQHCPCGCGGKVYPMKPKLTLRLVGQAPIQPLVYERERFRCNLCGDIFATGMPEGVDKKKNDPTAISMVGLLKYGTGFPFYRMAAYFGCMGIPLAAATQFEMVWEGSQLIKPAYDELTRLGAQGEILHSDDTGMKILQLSRTGALAEFADRTGVFTTGIVSILGDHKIALFYTGPKYSGENMGDLLKLRAKGLPAPIYMCDGLAHNSPRLSESVAGSREFDVLLANCLAHGRRYFVDIADYFPKECLYVLKSLRSVYVNDGLAKEKELDQLARLAFHQLHSKPVMDALRIWMQAKLDDKQTEPNSRLGKAFKYMLKHWGPLTLFLRVPGAGLDNNICERCLKRAVLNRKNSQFYQTPKGALVGDVYMSLIHTCELNGVNPFDYLTELQRHAPELLADPGNWMPWTYRSTLERLRIVPVSLAPPLAACA